MRGAWPIGEQKHDLDWVGWDHPRVKDTWNHQPVVLPLSKVAWNKLVHCEVYVILYINMYVYIYIYVYMYIYIECVCTCLIVLLIPLSLGHHIVCGVQIQIGRRKLLADVGGKRWKQKWCWRSTGWFITDDFTWQNNTPLLICWLVGQFPCSNKQFATLWSAKASWFTHEWENQMGYNVSIHSWNSHRFIFTQTTVSNCLAAILLPGIFTPCLNQKNVTTLLILISVSLIIDLTAKTHTVRYWKHEQMIGVSCHTS